MSRLVVTGGTGYLGRVVVELATAAGWDVRGLGSRDVDVRDGPSVAALVQAARPDAIVHTAYVRDGVDAWPVNVDGSASVSRAAASAGARLVHVSSDVVFDGRAGRPYREGDPVSPITDYGRSKAEAERRVLAVAPDAVVVRTSLIYGGPGRAPGTHERAAVEPAASFYTDELRCPVQVDDLARALLELCTLEFSGALHVAGPDGLSRHRFAELIAGRPVTGVPAPPDRPLDCRLDTTLAATILRTPMRAPRSVVRDRPDRADPE